MEKKNVGGIVVGILITLVVVLIAIVVLFSTNIISFNKKTESADKADKTSVVKTIKVDDSKDYVYDATYKYDNKYTEYDKKYHNQGWTIDRFGFSLEFSGIARVQNLKVPYININSEDAKKANSELNELYIEYAKGFDKYAANSMKNGEYVVNNQILTYKTYKQNNILSIVVIDGEAGTSPFVFNYHVYNFDLKTGESISYGELLEKLGYDKDTVVEKTQNSIKAKMNEVYKNNPEGDLSNACKYAVDSNQEPLYKTANCYDISWKLWQETIISDKKLYFSDNEGYLNILPILYIDFAQNGDVNRYLVKINK